MNQPLKLRLQWTNEAQRQRAVEAFGFGKVLESRTFYVADDVARRLQERALKLANKTVGELQSAHSDLRVVRNATLPDAAILCVVERAGADPYVEALVWPADRRIPTAMELSA